MFHFVLHPLKCITWIFLSFFFFLREKGIFDKLSLVEPEHSSGEFFLSILSWPKKKLNFSDKQKLNKNPLPYCTIWQATSEQKSLISLRVFYLFFYFFIYTPFIFWFLYKKKEKEKKTCLNRGTHGVRPFRH